MQSGTPWSNAAQRGVTCKIIVDAMGSRGFLGSEDARILKKAGVTIATALPVGFIGMWFSRADLRNHRKIVIIDEHIGYSGSQNLADPLLFKQDEGVGKWVDAMLRVSGPARRRFGPNIHDRLGIDYR